MKLPLAGIMSCLPVSAQAGKCYSLGSHSLPEKAETARLCSGRVSCTGAAVRPSHVPVTLGPSSIGPSRVHVGTLLATQCPAADTWHMLRPASLSVRVPVASF